MAESEVDIISHLLDVESQASRLIDEAQIEGNKRISQAKVKADELFSEKYHQMINEFEASFSERTKAFDAEHNQDFESYKQKLLQSEKDTEAFNAFVNKTLFNA